MFQRKDAKVRKDAKFKKLQPSTFDHPSAKPQLSRRGTSRSLPYEDIKATKDRTPWKEEGHIVQPEAGEAVWLFLSKWIELERVVRQIVSERTGKPTAMLPTMRNLGLLQVSNTWLRSEMDSIRRLRNNLVHGIELPEPSALIEAAHRLELILAELKEDIGSEIAADSFPNAPTSQN